MPLTTVLVEVTQPPETPVTVVMQEAADGDDGISAYQSYLNTTADDPVMSEAEWSASRLSGDYAPSYPRAIAVTGVTVWGSLADKPFPILLYATQLNGRPKYTDTGVTGGYYFAFWQTGAWWLRAYSGEWWSSTADVASPDLVPASGVGGWAPAAGDATGTPVVTSADVTTHESVTTAMGVAASTGFVSVLDGVMQSPVAAADAATPGTLVKRTADGAGAFAAAGANHSVSCYAAGTGAGVFGDSENGAGLYAMTRHGRCHGKFGPDSGISFEIGRPDGSLSWYEGVYRAAIQIPTLTGNLAWFLPPEGGTLALTSELENKVTQVTVRRASDLIRNNATPTADPVLTLSLEAASVYEIFAWMEVSCSGTSGFNGFLKFSSALDGINGNNYGEQSDNGGSWVAYTITSVNGLGASAIRTAASTRYAMKRRATIRTLLACTLEIMWAQNTLDAAQTATMLAGSFLSARKI